MQPTQMPLLHTGCEESQSESLRHPTHSPLALSQRPLPHCASLVQPAHCPLSQMGAPGAEQSAPDRQSTQDWVSGFQNCEPLQWGTQARLAHSAPMSQ
jgi:hypothetical protein